MDQQTDAGRAQSDLSNTQLLGARKFAPYFLTQFLGAFNDNVYKNGLIGLLTYQTTRLGLQDPGTSGILINIAALLFILPFFLFSATAGQVAEKYEKAALIRHIKKLEIAIMLIGAVAVVTASLWLLFFVLFLMGTQSTLFGPIKYSILPQHLTQGELTGGNALVESGTFLAILLGLIVGGLLVNVPQTGPALLSGLVVVLAICGYFSSRYIATAPATAPRLRISYNAPVETWRMLNFARSNRPVFLSMMGISWFWFYGSYFIQQVPAFGKDYLAGSQSVVTLLMAMFTLGIALGSLLCSRLSGRSIEIGLVPIGALGMTLFALDLSFCGLKPGQHEVLIGAGEYLQNGSWRVLIDLAGVAVSGGLYIVPLYALVQSRAQRSHLSRTIAALNIMNAAFMVVAAVLAVALLKWGLNIPNLFFVVALMNVVVVAFIFTLVPEFIMRLLVWLLMHTLYRLRRSGFENYPTQGPGLLVCNHVSFVDALIIASASRRPVRFVMYHKIFQIPVLSFIFRTGRAIPIAPKREDEALLEKAYADIANELGEGNLVCIFPEGAISDDGELHQFRSGVERIVATTPVPVYPMALRGLWGSFFSRKDGPAMRRLPRRFYSRIELAMGPPVPPGEAKRDYLHQRVLELRGDWR